MSENGKIHADRFYDLLRLLESKVAGMRCLKDCHGRMGWPKRGVYFFFDGDEYRSDGSQQLRVVRVGTHAVGTGSKSTLWGRLRSHKGTGAGTGNHRGSIFRLHVGNALLNKHGAWTLPEWGRGSSASRQIKQSEQGLEREVSTSIGALPFLWVEVDDEPGASSHRAYIERNAIILLAGPDGCSPIDKPGLDWLGHYSDRVKIRESGLWNLDHIGHPDNLLSYDPDFLDVLERHVDAM
ncbi:MAG: hypothetical protein L0154_25005 [Chloroflexi bacterium]|nr:hypothetical protein [Chloroflexota bacterium]